MAHLWCIFTCSSSVQGACNLSHVNILDLKAGCRLKQVQEALLCAVQVVRMPCTTLFICSMLQHAELSL